LEVRELILCVRKKQKPNAICFSLWGDNIVGWIHNKGDDGSGSLLSLWHKEVFSYEYHLMGKGFIIVYGQHLKSSSRCVVVNVYSPCALSGKKTLWEELSNAKLASQESAWCFCDDFNVVRSRSERKGIRDRGDQSSEIKDFISFIESNSLIELPLVGKNFMWFKTNGTTKSRIDRVLVTKE